MHHDLGRHRRTARCSCGAASRSHSEALPLVRLVQQLDPEDYRAVVQAYQAMDMTCWLPQTESGLAQVEER